MRPPRVHSHPPQMFHIDEMQKRCHGDHMITLPRIRRTARTIACTLILAIAATLWSASTASALTPNTCGSSPVACYNLDRGPVLATDGITAETRCVAGTVWANASQSSCTARQYATFIVNGRRVSAYRVGMYECRGGCKRLNVLAPSTGILYQSFAVSGQWFEVGTDLPLGIKRPGG